MLAWKPGTIITRDENFYRTVGSDSSWAGIKAVREGRVHLSPGLPFGRIDRPPSLNRLIGLKWLAGVFYPDKVRQDIRAEAREFYATFYQVELDDAALDRLLGPANDQSP